MKTIGREWKTSKGIAEIPTKTYQKPITLGYWYHHSSISIEALKTHYRKDLIMFKDKTRKRKFWTHKGRIIPKEVLDFLFEYDPATGNLYRIRENDGRHIIPPKVVRVEHFNIYDSMNTRKRFKVKDLVSLIVNR